MENTNTTMPINDIYHWVLKDIPDSIANLSEVSIIDIMELSKTYDVMIREINGKFSIALDAKGKKFKQR